MTDHHGLLEPPPPMSLLERFLHIQAPCYPRAGKKYGVPASKSIITFTVKVDAQCGIFTLLALPTRAQNYPRVGCMAGQNRGKISIMKSVDRILSLSTSTKCLKGRNSVPVLLPPTRGTWTGQVRMCTDKKHAHVGCPFQHGVFAT